MKKTEKKGFLGLSRKVDYKTEIIYFKIKDFVNVESDEEAYFLDFLIRARIKDDHWAKVPYQKFVIITNKNLAENTFDYLQKNPQEYYKLIKELLPRGKYPNVNSNILDKVEPSSGVKFKKYSPEI